jgi:RND family efflux transporter MFP subunit
VADDASPDPTAILGSKPSEPADDASDSPSISNYRLVAPFSGTVLDRAVLAPGIAVQEGASLFTLADLSTVWVEANIPEGAFGRLSGIRDASVELTSPAYPGRSFTGRVIYSGDLVDEKTRSVHLLARAENPDRALKPGMFVQVEVQAGAHRVTMIPVTALLTEDELHLVFVRTGPDRFERREVKVGARDGDRVAILDGLTVGEEVVTEGAFKLKAIDERGAEALAAEPA